MLINLPARHSERQRALAWLNAQGIAHETLYQKVQVQIERDAERFRTWLDGLR